ncbi:PREDICTED: serine/threonine-protein kinase LMTK1-like, partial [Rhinopithecus bieti]|uniref:serine/threonine-protein kinase LMTK1-like n=1 Tax=Rhinopithecus bieti TaxID=61621 RepID=UPI00083BC68D
MSGQADGFGQPGLYVQAPQVLGLGLARSLGVTIWELFELGTQPYPQHSDQQVLAYAVREQQLKLPKPQLQLTLSDR